MSECWFSNITNWIFGEPKHYGEDIFNCPGCAVLREVARMHPMSAKDHSGRFCLQRLHGKQRGNYMRHINMREVNWAVQRMRRIVMVWKKLDSVDRLFLFRKFRDENPREFWEAAREKEPTR